MFRPSTALHRVAALVVLGIAACGPARGAPAPETTPPAAAARSPAELNALYRARVDSARTRFTAADVQFMTGMIGHHAQAILMAELATGRGASAPVTTLAARIISAQRDEIELMQAWLRDRGQPVPVPHIEGTTLMLHGAPHALHDMRGMITPAQLAELDRARGRDFDRLLLLYMIEHHRGAVTMVHELFASPGAARDPGLARLASEIQADQLIEITRMMRLLADLSTPHEARP
jgi:uncharacterized protein (DUF305 family)